jgi:hypothetical protein
VTAAPPGWLPAAGTEPEAVIREARRRQHRRYLVAGVALAAVLAGAAGVITAVSSGSHSQRPVSHSARTAPAHAMHPAPGLILAGAATTLVMWPVGPPNFTNTGGPPAYVDDLTTGHLSQRQVPGIIGCDCQPYLIGAGQRLAYVGSGGTTAIPAGLTGKPQVLGTTPFFAPAAGTDHVWLIRYRNWQLDEGPVQVRPVPVTGGPPGPAITLPHAVSGLIRGTGAGLLVEVNHGNNQELALWNPDTALRILPYSGSYGALTASARLVAYGTGCEPFGACKRLRILNVVTGRVVSFPAPAGTAGWVPNGFDLFSEISPGNQMIAAYAATQPQRKRQARLYVIRITSPSHRPRAVPSSAAPLFARTAWSAKDSWLLYQGPGGHLWAYQVTTGKVRASSTPCCQYTAMAAVPNRPG